MSATAGTPKPIVLVPDPVLRTPARPVGSVDDQVRSVCADLIATMRATGHSVGVAAPQIGVSLRIFCIDVTDHPKSSTCHGELVLADPEVLAATGTETAREGCMSVPDLTGDVPRASRIVVRGLTPAGHVRVIETDAFEARAVLHEIDHLDGKVFLDRVCSARHVYRRKVYR
jgi:peptide deformylase